MKQVHYKWDLIQIKPVEIIIEGAFDGIYFRDIYSGVNRKRYRNSWKEFNKLKNIYQKFIAQIIMTLN